MNPNRITLERGCALVLRGPQGCGKSLLARQIAMRHGRYTALNPNDLTSAFTDWLASEPDAVIVDEADMLCPRGVAAVKLLVTNGQAVLARKGHRPAMVRSPLVILCSQGMADWINSAGPRFRVVDLPRLS